MHELRVALITLLLLQPAITERRTHITSYALSSFFNALVMWSCGLGSAGAMYTTAVLTDFSDSKRYVQNLREHSVLDNNLTGLLPLKKFK